MSDSIIDLFDGVPCAEVLQYVPCMKGTVSVAGTETVTVPPWIPSITVLPLFKWWASSSAGVISWLGGPPRASSMGSFGHLIYSPHLFTVLL